MKIQDIYKDDEIIRRIIESTSPLSGPTCFAVVIKYIAPNDVEPPIITAAVIDTSDNERIFDLEVNQNTTVEYFDMKMLELVHSVQLCLQARKHNNSFKEEKANEEKVRKERVESGDLPF